ncbi:VOC family protein [Aliikangiella marina]|uniref:VOC family protein n=1 Tax=Aliikangiella marina TaxID=1712262 RepID=A0A545T9V2_9GAMM|nr:VOC family protein [Aliikangiella marina]TQV73992.1 VOC family protein [Aliikangiella marina]
MSNHNKINYIEFQVSNIAKTKAFFEQVFGWSFTDYGEEYCAINDAGIDAGFYISDNQMRAESGSALIVLYSEDLATTQTRIEQAGGEISKPIFSFPGGRRFHFLDVNGNEFAVWSE